MTITRAFLDLMGKRCFCIIRGIMFNSDNFSPLVIILAIIMSIALITTFISDVISSKISKDNKEICSNIIKITGFMIVAICSIIIALTLRG